MLHETNKIILRGNMPQLCCPWAIFFFWNSFQNKALLLRRNDTSAQETIDRYSWPLIDAIRLTFVSFLFSFLVGPSLQVRYAGPLNKNQIITVAQGQGRTHPKLRKNQVKANVIINYEVLIINSTFPVENQEKYRICLREKKYS